MVQPFFKNTVLLQRTPRGSYEDGLYFIDSKITEAHHHSNDLLLLKEPGELSSGLLMQGTALPCN